MSEEEINAVELSAKIEDGVVLAEVKVDVIDALRDLAKQSDNTIDDAIVEIVAAARGNMDWKGVAKKYL